MCKVDIKSYLWFHVLVLFCKSEKLCWGSVLFCVSLAKQLMWPEDVGTEGCIVYSTCIYDRPIMQQPQHVLTVSYFSTAFIFRLALLTFRSAEDWKHPTVTDKMSSCGYILYNIIYIYYIYNINWEIKLTSRSIFFAWYMLSLTSHCWLAYIAKKKKSLNRPCPCNMLHWQVHFLKYCTKVLWLSISFLWYIILLLHCILKGNIVLFIPLFLSDSKIYFSETL